MSRRGDRLGVSAIRGKSLVEEIIDPITGGFPRLHANAAAWKHTGKSLAKIADNLNYNARVLTGNHWEGEAADAFRSGIGDYWTGLNGVAGICFIVGEGFEALYRACEQAALYVAEKVLPRILSLLRKIAMKFAPGVGQAWEFLEALMELEIPYVRYVQMIEEAVGQVTEIIGKIEALVKSFNAYTSVIESAGSIVAQMANLDPHGVGPSGADVVRMGLTMKQAGEHVIELTGRPEKDPKTGQYRRDNDGNLILKGGSKTHEGIVRKVKEVSGDMRREAEEMKKQRGRGRK